MNNPPLLLANVIIIIMYVRLHPPTSGDCKVNFAASKITGLGARSSFKLGGGEEEGAIQQSDHMHSIAGG